MNDKEYTELYKKGISEPQPVLKPDEIDIDELERAAIGRQYLKYKGYGYHGGGRKPSSPDGQPRRTTMTISGTRSEIEAIRKLAKSDGKSVSRYVIERVLECCDNLEKILDDRPQLSIDRDGNLTFDSCENCEYITKRLGERDGVAGWIMQCKIGHPCTGYACQHYKSRYGDK